MTRDWWKENIAYWRRRFRRLGRCPHVPIAVWVADHESVVECVSCGHRFTRAECTTPALAQYASFAPLTLPDPPRTLEK